MPQHPNRPRGHNNRPGPTRRPTPHDGPDPGRRPDGPDPGRRPDRPGGPDPDGRPGRYAGSVANQRPDPQPAPAPNRGFDREPGTSSGADRRDDRPGSRRVDSPNGRRDNPTNDRRDEPIDEGHEVVRLELLRLELTPGKGVFGGETDRTWDIYLVLEADDPTDRNRKIIIRVPKNGGVIDFTKDSDNVYKFGHMEKGGREGMEIYSGPMPKDRRLSATIHAIQDKSKTRNFGEVLGTVTDILLDDVAPILGEAAASNPYVAGARVVAKGANAIAKLVEKTGDRDRGFASLDEKFDDPAFRNGGSVGRKALLSGGDASILYSWTTAVLATKR